MPPHSEVENDHFGIEYVRVRQRKRSRSISPGFLTRRKSSGRRNSRSSRSSSVSSEVRGPLPIVIQQLSVVKASDQKVSTPVVVSFHEAPPFLQFNPFIYRGYRTNICPKTCLKRYVCSISATFICRPCFFFVNFFIFPVLPFPFFLLNSHGILRILLPS